MAHNADADGSDRSSIALVCGLDHGCADASRDRSTVLMSTRWQLPRHMRALCRRLLLLSRLGQWALVIRRVRTDYRLVTGRAPALLRPRRFTEKMQWRKLFELDPLFAVLSDKLAARDFVAARIGQGRQADLLWVGNEPDAIPFDQLVPPYVLKSTHAAGQTIIVRDTAALDVAAARTAARGWLAYCHGTAMNEPAYTHLPRRLIVERLLQCPDGTPPPERKVYVFGGRAIFIRTNTPDANGQPLFGDLHSRDWTRLPITWWSPVHPVPPPPPTRLADIISIAECLGAGLSHCRVDIYDHGDTLTVGEVTLYSQSGLVVYSDPAFDLVLGAHWAIRWPMLRALRAVAVRRWEIRPPQA
jgi:hypothetical protein